MQIVTGTIIMYMTCTYVLTYNIKSDSVVHRETTWCPHHTHIVSSGIHPHTAEPDEGLPEGNGLQEVGLLCDGGEGGVHYGQAIPHPHHLRARHGIPHTGKEGCLSFLYYSVAGDECHSNAIHCKKQSKEIIMEALAP